MGSFPLATPNVSIYETTDVTKGKKTRKKPLDLTKLSNYLRSAGVGRT